ncbi:MAG: hypothetical protein HKM95_13775 [Inquilinus sp.]|nr:hypothetical protein [Inquilinus sp.]
MKPTIAVLARLAPLPLLALALLLPPGTARADAIDGHWCADDGRHLSIEGPAITTPGGKRLSGQYRRHYFSYVVPASEPNAGAATAMTLVSDDIVHLKVLIDAAKTEVWRRCDFTS